MSPHESHVTNIYISVNFTDFLIRVYTLGTCVYPCEMCSLCPCEMYFAIIKLLLFFMLTWAKTMNLCVHNMLFLHVFQIPILI